MTDRPIIRLPDPREAGRKKQKPPRFSPPKGPGRGRQGQRFQASFDQLAAAIGREDQAIELRDDPAGIAPDRALVFETAGPIQDFARAARDAGLELLMEEDLDELEDIPDGFTPPTGKETLPRTLYTTMPTVASSDRLLGLWRAHQRNEVAPHGATPCWRLFDLLMDLRTWGPDDRFPAHAREIVADRLPDDDDQDVTLELEIWPSNRGLTRAAWRDEAIAKVQDLGGTIVHRSNIDEHEFVYDALLVRLRAGDVRQLIADPFAPESLAWIKGIQLILPQTIAQALPDDAEQDADADLQLNAFDPQSPVRAALLDGVPLAAHPAIDGGLTIEDVHDIVTRSVVDQRRHATSMASLILRGDLEHDAKPLSDSHLISVPVMIDNPDGRARSPADRLFVDVVHTALAALFNGPDAVAPNVFVINFSIGIPDMRFAGRMSALARLIDWWSSEYGILFVISSGNIPNNVTVPNITAAAFEDADLEDQRELARRAIAESGFERTLLAPAESLNALTVGAASKDLAPVEPPPRANIVRIDQDDEPRPALSSAIGLGLRRALKPDLLNSGGFHDIRFSPGGDATSLNVANPSQFAGLVVAAPTFALGQTTKRAIGTSCAAALTTREILHAANELVTDGGPFEGQELPRSDLALLTRALAINAARWPAAAQHHYRMELERFGSHRSSRAKEEVARHYGHGLLSPDRMRESPESGATLVGLGTLRKDGAKIFDLPLPPSLAGERIPRSMHITLTWFSPVDLARAKYRLAGLEAIASDNDGQNDEDKDTTWGLALQGEGPDDAMAKRGTVWSRRLKHKRLTVPNYGDHAKIPIRVQCRDVSGGGLNPDIDVRFAIAVTLVAEAQVQFDIHQEIRDQIRLRLRAEG